MSAGNFAKGIDHREHNQPEGQGDADVRDGSAAHFIDDDGARAREYQGKGPEEFGGHFSAQNSHMNRGRKAETRWRVLKFLARKLAPRKSKLTPLPRHRSPRRDWWFAASFGMRRSH